jgi:hypothetical protein
MTPTKIIAATDCDVRMVRITPLEADRPIVAPRALAGKRRMAGLPYAK